MPVKKSAETLARGQIDTKLSLLILQIKNEFSPSPSVPERLLEPQMQKEVLRLAAVTAGQAAITLRLAPAD